MDLTQKKYICRNCGHRDKHIMAIKDNRSITSDFLAERIEHLGEIKPLDVYTYEVIRDEIGIVLYKLPVKCHCHKCDALEIEYIPGDNESNVLNFYPAAESEKWLRGFEGLGKR